jgi:hypothetical protein
MVKAMQETKNALRDQMEYILLISFVFLGSAFVVASELQTAQSAGKPQPAARRQDLMEAPHRHVIFGQSTKRHIK